MLLLLVLSPLFLGVSMQRTTTLATRGVLRGWFPNACTLVICAPPETEERDQGLPAVQELQGVKEDINNSEFERLETQIRDLQTQLDILKASVIKTQQVLLTPHGVIVGKKIFKTDGTRGDYDAGRASCSHMGSTLAVPRDAAENSAIQQIVTWHNAKALLGITDMAEEDKFVDQNGSVIEYSNWAQGEPNSKGNEDCVEMHPDGKWHDRDCALDWLIICEF
ncbi:pulmonary surfactant-associated protein D isoform X3 [Pogona vitticeps]